MTNQNQENVSAGIGAWTMAPFLFFSGLCALVYQICWTREFRLIFGASTAASAAVIAIFIGGLGAGGIVIGRRVDKSDRPLMLYGWMEMMIAGAAALSPLFLWVIRWAYLTAGGTTTMGMVGGTIVRLVLATLVLGVPTFLMGGTLPAAVRAVVSEDDRGRRRLALLYGINTIGAVVGSALATFFMIEQWGTRSTLWMAALVNVALGALVVLRARTTGKGLPLPMPPKEEPEQVSNQEAPAWFVLPAAAVVGFAFFLMEIVWYRMLSPILGGSVFTFGLILCLVLLGIGIGGLLYSMRSSSRPARLWGFALTCLLEAGMVMVAYAMGDRLAWVATTLQAWSVFGFGGIIMGWAVVAGIAVLPAAVVAGYQFPLLIALLGQGKKDIGRHVGAAYAWNTGGAICGSLAGGFVLLPILSALGCWRMVGIMLAILGVWALFIWIARTRQWTIALVPAAMAAIVLAMCISPTGPTAAWRHSGVGVGRVNFNRTPSSNEFHSWISNQRLWVRHEMEGVESCIGIDSCDGLAFVVNGKIDGNAIGDAGTQVMSGLAGAMLHGSPKSAAVVGLGGGSTAGWLGAIPSMERVDCVELEPAVLEYAKLCDAVNHGCMTNPKVKISIGDAREYLMTSPRKYDLVVSEPSNPYRAGIASLFTREYYQSVAGRLEDRGIFVQWVQSYNVDSRTVQTIYATLLSVFPNVETWQAGGGDLLLIASKKPVDHDVARLSAMVRQEPYRSGLVNTWRTADVEGFYGHFIVNSDFAKFFTNFPGILLNTDDRTLIEFGFARAANMPTRFSLWELREAAKTMGQHRPATVNGSVDWSRVEEEMALYQAADGSSPSLKHATTGEQMQRLTALKKYMDGDFAAALAAWRAQPAQPRGPMELAVLAEALAAAGDDTAVSYIDQLRSFQPVEADLILARLRIRQGKLEAGANNLLAAFAKSQRDPWARRIQMRRGLTLALLVGKTNQAQAKRLGEALCKEFAAASSNQTRQETLMQLANYAQDLPLMLEALAAYEPFGPWSQDFLSARANAYKAAGHQLTVRAMAELSEYRRGQGEAVIDDMMDAAAQDGKATAMLEKQ